MLKIGRGFEYSMKILAIEKEVPGVPPKDFLPHLKLEAMHVWELYQADIVREIYFDKNQHRAVIILECSDLAQAEELLNSFPLVKAGLINFDISSLIPYPGFRRLFEEDRDE